MSDLELAKQEIERGLRTYRAFEQADRVLAVLQGLEQNERELLAKIELRKREMDTVEAEAAERIAKAETAAQHAEQDAALAGQEAQLAAARLVQEATERARAIVSKAKAEAGGIDEEIVKAKIALAAIRRDIQASESTQAGLQASLAQLRETIQGIMKAGA